MIITITITSWVLVIGIISSDTGEGLTQNNYPYCQHKLMQYKLLLTSAIAGKTVHKGMFHFMLFPFVDYTSDIFISVDNTAQNICSKGLTKKKIAHQNTIVGH